MNYCLYPNEKKIIGYTEYKNCGCHAIYLTVGDSDYTVKYKTVTESQKSRNPMASQQSWKQKHKR